MDSPVEVVTVGHAIVDVLAPVEDSVVAGFGLEKGTMNLVDDERSARLYAALGPATAVSGGSAANTATGLASLGATVAFVGRVHDDELGRVFGNDIRAAGVDYRVPAALDGPGTGTSMIMVTPDAERTMCTSLGAGDLLEPADVDARLICSARLVYLEGYLVGLPTTDPTVQATLEAASRGQTEVALSLSDPQWVTLHGKELDALVDRVDLLFANEQEILGLTGKDDLVAAAAGLARRGPTVIVTRGPLGALVVTRRGPGGNEVREELTVVTVPAEQVGRVVDTTGAGDLFASGYLFGHVRGLGPEQAARLGTMAAAEIISHFGARPTGPLGPVAAGRGLLSPA
jgi:sugar/nucleoside kinase (ribokinase family)